MSFAIWFIILGSASLGIGAIVNPCMESPLYRLLWAPGVLLSGGCRYLGARLAGLPVSQVRILRGEGRGVRVDTGGANVPKVLLLSLLSYVGPIVVCLVINGILQGPLSLDRPLPALHPDSRALAQFGAQAGAYLQDIWLMLRRVVPHDPAGLLLLYLLVGVLISNPPGKGESLPLFLFAILLGGMHALGVTLDPGSRGGEMARVLRSGLGVALAHSLLALAVAAISAAVWRARAGHDSGRAR